MITEIILRNFGKFRDKGFKLSPVTLFYGQNESGKTTIFDALAVELCHPKRSEGIGKIIYSRYGEEVDVELKTDGSPIPGCQIREFMDLFAIREGELQFNLDTDVSWFKTLKANLFSGGIDPAKLVEIFGSLSSHDRRLWHNKELIKCEEEINKIESELIRLKSEEKNILSLEAKIGADKHKKEGVLASLKGLQQRYQEKKNELDFQDKALKRKKLNEVIEYLEKYEKQKKELAELSSFSSDCTTEIAAREEEVKKLQETIQLNQATAQYLNEEIKILGAKQTDLREKNGLVSRYAGVVAWALQEISRLETLMKGIVQHNKPLLIGSILLTISGVTLTLIAKSPWFISLLIPGIILYFLSRKTDLVPDRDKETVFINKLKTEFYIRTENALKLEANEIKGLNNELLKIKVNIEKIGEELTMINSQLEEKKMKMEEWEKKTEQLNLKLSECTSRLTEFYQKIRVNSKEEYIRKRTLREQIAKDFATTENKVSSFINEYEVNKVEELKRKCATELYILDEKGIPSKSKTVLELNQLKNEVEELEERIKNLDKEREEVEGRIREETTRLNTSLGPVMRGIIENERKLAELKEKIREINLDKQAAANLKEIFQELVSSSDVVMMQLAEEIKEYFAEIVPGMREINISGFRNEEIAVQDAGGVKRPLDHLSTGTRESFAFAARLLLALKVRKDRRFLLLDEPFPFADLERLGNLLKMLKKFTNEQKWQVILFTKDEELVQYSQQIFGPELTVHQIV